MDSQGNGTQSAQSQRTFAGLAACAFNIRIVAPFLSLAATLWLAPHVDAQRGGRGGAGQASPAMTPKQASPIDISGYWVSLVTDDWRGRMVTPPKGDYLYLPLNPAGRQLADTWDPAKDEAAGESCKGYGAPSIMHLPGRLHLTWADEATLKLEADAGTQTRVFHFGRSGSDPSSGSDPANDPVNNSWQGYSTAQWEVDGAGRRGRAAAAPARHGSLKVVTNRLRTGYFRKNGVPYSANAVLTEYFTTLNDGGVDYLVVTNFLEDTQYLAQPYVRSVQFKRQADAKGWNPTACSAR